LAAQPTLAARALAEGLGTGLLVAVVVGSGIAAERLSPDDVGLQLLENSTATVLALAALILAFGAVSGAHFNPVVTLVERVRGKVDDRVAGVHVVAQLAGGAAGAVLANLMFELSAIELSTHDRITGATFLAEVVATFGLVLVIAGVVHAGRPGAVPVAVAGYIGAAYWFTSSTSFANPAVTVARMLSDSFAGIAPASVPAFVAAQVLGGVLALAAARVLFPDPDPALAEVLDA
jgi:arsenate reductase